MTQEVKNALDKVKDYDIGSLWYIADTKSKRIQEGQLAKIEVSIHSNSVCNVLLVFEDRLGNYIAICPLDEVTKMAFATREDAEMSIDLRCM